MCIFSIQGIHVSITKNTTVLIGSTVVSVYLSYIGINHHAMFCFGRIDWQSIANHFLSITDHIATGTVYESRTLTGGGKYFNFVVRLLVRFFIIPEVCSHIRQHPSKGAVIATAFPLTPANNRCYQQSKLTISAYKELHILLC